MTSDEFETYLTDRVENQIKYFDTRAVENQRRYKLLKHAGILSNLGTTILIALALALTGDFLRPFAISALILSAIVLGTYQWEEFAAYGMKWERFRLVAEQLKSHRQLFMQACGIYSTSDLQERQKILVDYVEKLLTATDVSYFVTAVEPGRHIDKQLKNI